MSRQRFLFIFLAALVSFIFLTTRLYNFPNRFGFDHDQEMAANAAWKIFVERKPILIGQETSIGGLFVGPFLYYFQAIAISLGNFHPLMLGYLAVAISFATLISLFLVTKDITKNYAQAFLAAILYSISAKLIFYDDSASAISFIML